MQSLNIFPETLSQKSNCVISLKVPTIDDLDLTFPDRDSQFLLSDRIYQYLAEDPDNCLKNFCFQNDLKVNFQAIALAKLTGKSWTEIADEFNVNLKSLISFFQDCCCFYADLLEHKL